ncbi:MAG: hypothetical protein ACR2QC_04645 [Gammaproteobacteria bacterium]
MMTPSAVAAAAINARLTPDLRRRLRAHAGAAVAVHIGGLRMCFRLGEDGRWRAASPLIDADAEMRTDGGDFSVSGGGALLRDLDEVRRRCAPQLLAEEIFGADGADCLRRTTEKIRECLRDLPARCGVAATPSEVAEFVRETAAFDAATSAAAARLSRLEERR